jgi:hypothetical protein
MWLNSNITSVSTQKKNHKYGDIGTLKLLEIVLSGVHSNFISLRRNRFGGICDGLLVI